MATQKWRGAAASVAQVTTITFSAYTSGQTYTLTCNGKDISYTAAASTIGDVVDGLIAALAATSELEFADFTAASNSGLVLTAVTAGVPFTVTASATGGITATVTETTAATGPNFFDNADNWEGGSVPSASDDLVFEQSSVSLLYALEDTTNYGDITIDSTYTGSIGLPVDNASGYREYRPRFLKLGDGTSAFAITIGQGTGGQSPRILIDGNDATFTATIYGTGTSTSSEYAVELKNFDNSSTIDIYGGSVLLDADTSGAFSALRITPAGFASPTVSVAAEVTGGTVACAGGNLSIAGTVTSIDASGGASVTVTNAGTAATVSTSTGATVLWQTTAGIATKLNIYGGGVADFSANGAAKTVANLEIFATGTLIDSEAILTYTNGIIVSGCKLSDVNVDVGRNQTITPS